MTGERGVESDGEARVRLMSRVGCHLCDDARGIVSGLCAERGIPWSEVDVDSDPDLERAYGHLIPVVTIDGEQVAFWQVDAHRFAAELDARMRKRRCSGDGR